MQLDRRAPRGATNGESALAPRLPGLDLLRAGAISWVMLYHASLFGLASPKHWIVRFGWMGVDLFFALSGFLIAGQLLRPWARGLRPSYTRFFGRRLLRTVPAYLAVVAAYFLVPALRERPSIQPLWQFLTFTENVLIVPPLPKAFSQAWSLCIEEQFYLVLPIVITILAIRSSAAKVVSTIVAILLLGMVLRGYLWLGDVARPPFDVAARPNAGAYMRLIYWPTWTRLDGLLAGVGVATIKTFRPGLWETLTARPNLLLALGCAGVGAASAFFGNVVTGFLAAVLAFPLLALCMAMIVMAASESRSLIGRQAVPGAGLMASVAYSLYLTHKAVFHAVETTMSHAPAPIQSMGLPIALIAALAVGAGLYGLVERPFLKLRDRVEGPSRSTLAGPAAEPAHAR